jgi:hypothetical protein
VLLFGVALTPVSGEPEAYPWLRTYDPAQSLEQRIPAPSGYERVPAEPGSYGAWLRGLPLKKPESPVLLHNGRPKSRQDVHVAVVDIDTGERDLQQCADAVIRLRAEYLFSKGAWAVIHFNFTSGDRVDYVRWRGGDRPVVQGNRVRWERTAAADDSHRGFRKYPDTVFTYAGSASLVREMAEVRDPAAVQAGDVFIRGGFPGHAVMVVDTAAHRESGRRAVLLAQSYMPAQDIHVLKNFGDPALSPWYPVDFGETLETPEWTFRRDEIRRFREER